MSRRPTTGPLRVLRLGAALAMGKLRGGTSSGDVVHRWIRRETARHGRDDFVVNLLGKKVMLVTGRDLSATVLAAPPELEGVAAGNLKRKGMSYLAPQALTISHGDEWKRRRAFNEEVLNTGQPHDLRPQILEAVRKAFSSPVQSIADVRGRLARVMLEIDFGGSAPPSLATDLAKLVGLVQSPVKRALFGRLNVRRRRQFYANLRAQWDDAAEDSLLGLARRSGAEPTQETLEQIPHWMFTFAGSATDLAVRAMLLIGSRQAVYDEVRRELAATDAPGTPASVEQLAFLEACILEAGRLYPPVTRTFHVAPGGAVGLPAGVEVITLLSYPNRNTEADPSANDFVPKRWLTTEARAHDRYPNLFLSGPRACPGRDLILFVIKAALADQFGGSPVVASTPSLAQDPVPISFPSSGVRFGE